MKQLAFLIAVALICIGFYCMIRKRNMLKLIIGLNIFESGLITLLLAFGYREGGRAPIVSPGTVQGPYVDPLPQALALTGIVIGAGVTALGLSLISKLHKDTKTLDVSEIVRGLKR